MNNEEGKNVMTYKKFIKNHSVPPVFPYEKDDIKEYYKWWINKKKKVSKKEILEIANEHIRNKDKFRFNSKVDLFRADKKLFYFFNRLGILNLPLFVDNQYVESLKSGKYSLEDILIKYKSLEEIYITNKGLITFIIETESEKSLIPLINVKAEEIEDTREIETLFISTLKNYTETLKLTEAAIKENRLVMEGLLFSKKYRLILLVLIIVNSIIVVFSMARLFI